MDDWQWWLGFSIGTLLIHMVVNLLRVNDALRRIRRIEKRLGSLLPADSHTEDDLWMT